MVGRALSGEEVRAIRLGSRQRAALEAAARDRASALGVPWGIEPGSLVEHADVPLPDGGYLGPRYAFLLLERLEERGLVERQDDPYFGNVFVATEEGREALRNSGG